MSNSKDIQNYTNALYRSSPAIRRLLSDLSSASSKVGVSTIPMLILSSLEEHEKMSMSDLAEHLSLTKSNATMYVDKLVERKLVERMSDKEDRRVIYIKINSAGRKFLESCKNGTIIGLQRNLISLPSKDLDDLTEALEVIARILSKDTHNQPVE